MCSLVRVQSAILCNNKNQYIKNVFQKCVLKIMVKTQTLQELYWYNPGSVLTICPLIVSLAIKSLLWEKFPAVARL